MSATLADERWLVRSERRPDAELRLYCFHHAGGTAAEFTRWGRYLPDTVEVCAVQLPGRGARAHERPHTRMRPLVEELLGRLPTDRPFVFFGHSFGSLVAYELTLAGARPQHLFLSARPAPHLPGSMAPLHALPDEEFIQIIDQRHGGVPPELWEQPELRKLVLPYFRADYEVLETYEAGPPDPVEVPITVLGGTDDGVGLESLEAWREHAAGSFEVRMFPGDHFYLRPQRTAVLSLVRSAMG